MLENLDISRNSHPLDLLEQVAIEQNWAFDRVAENETDLVLSGTWGDCPITVNWQSELELIHLVAEFDLKAPDVKRSSILELLALINQQIFLGHFDIWSHEGIVVFRYGLLLNGGAKVTKCQCQELVAMAVRACDRFYPAFQYVMWAGKSPDVALSMAIFETRGQA